MKISHRFWWRLLHTNTMVSKKKINLKSGMVHLKHKFIYRIIEKSTKFGNVFFSKRKIPDQFKHYSIKPHSFVTCNELYR
ncbi:hypothetical protein GYH30_034232 [Glycine max]|uniref:Uncharacterized protein n=1 Tax=Glycine max TaxID=3847 RepID=A0A0R0HJU0_SOYBN|nr:hypothetical protein GYH30_034232 [Glycine max]